MNRTDVLKASYGKTWYDNQQAGSERSAMQILPFVFDLLEPKSVCDFGCGVGTWLSVAKRLGASDILGIDGPHVQSDQLRVDPGEFLAHDLETRLTIPRRFDLAISLEVMEHFEDRFADAVLDSLTEAAPFILFSAAVPGQGGDHHVNERWPSYWLRKFEMRDYRAFDCIRPTFWRDPQVKWWYAQNTFLLASAAWSHRLASVAHTHVHSRSPMLNVVHPVKIKQRAQPGQEWEI
jgi:SAM-dependent methyltransferase